MQSIKVETPFSEENLKQLRAGDLIMLSGELYTGRDAAHKRMTELLENNSPLPFDIRGQTVYYVGPCPAPPGRIIGSAGPTTSSRMDAYTPRLMDEGLKVMIGKGLRSDEVIAAIRKHSGLYLTAVGGAGALLSMCIKKVETVAFAELGTEAVYRFTVCDMPLVVAIDGLGNSIYVN